MSLSQRVWELYQEYGDDLPALLGVPLDSISDAIHEIPGPGEEEFEAKVAALEHKRTGIDAASLRLQFESEVANIPAVVDPAGDRSWHDIAYGFFLARGAAPAIAHLLATEVNED